MADPGARPVGERRSATPAAVVVVCANQRLFAELAAALAHRGWIAALTDIPGEAGRLAAAGLVDVCVLDERDTPAGAVNQILRAAPGTAVIVLSTSQGRPGEQHSLAFGGSAVVGVDEGVERVVALLEDVRRREGTGPAPGTTSDVAKNLGELTSKERQVLHRLIQGHPTKVVANELGITYSTARTHIQKILVKLEVHSKLEAVTLVIASGWPAQHETDVTPSPSAESGSALSPGPS